MRQVVAPSARAGHRYRHWGLLVHLHDETVLLDLTSELSVPLAMLTSNRQPHDDLWSRSGMDDVADVMRRGRLRSESSLRRYGMETKLLAKVRKIDPLVIDYGRCSRA